MSFPGGLSAAGNNSGYSRFTNGQQSGGYDSYNNIIGGLGGNRYDDSGSSQRPGTSDEKWSDWLVRMYFIRS
jgi:hypothetical protein